MKVLLSRVAYSPLLLFFQSPEGNCLCVLCKALGTFHLQEEGSIGWWLKLGNGNLEISVPLTCGHRHAES